VPLSADALTPDLQIRKRSLVPSSQDPSLSPSPPPSNPPSDIVPPRQSAQSQANRLSANRLNDILGIVQNAQNEVQNALKFRSGNVNGNNVSRLEAVSPTTSKVPTSAALVTPPSSSSSKKQSHSSERRKQLPSNEMFAFSSDDEDDDGVDSQEEGGDKKGLKRDPTGDEDNDLEKTLDNWLTKQSQQQRLREREMKMKISSSSRRGGQGADEPDTSRRGGGQGEEEDDGGVADLQCLLADVLMSSGEEQQSASVSDSRQAQGSSLRGRFDIL
jgi:hypothetical protein